MLGCERHRIRNWASLTASHVTWLSFHPYINSHSEPTKRISLLKILFRIRSSSVYFYQRITVFEGAGCASDLRSQETQASARHYFSFSLTITRLFDIIFYTWTAVLALFLVNAACTLFYHLDYGVLYVLNNSIIPPQIVSFLSNVIWQLQSEPVKPLRRISSNFLNRRVF